MKAIISKTLIVLTGFSSTAYASIGSPDSAISILLTLFLAFLAMLVLTMLVPALKIFTEILKAHVASDQEEAEKHLN